MIFLALLGFPVLMALSSIFNGYALKVLWGWFIVPIFHLPFLNIPSAIGISLVVGYLTKQADSYVDKDKSAGVRIGESFLRAFLQPAIALFIGWIVQKFM